MSVFHRRFLPRTGPSAGTPAAAKVDRADTPRRCRATNPWRKVILLLVLLLAPSAPAAPQEPHPDRGRDVIARVNGTVITRRAFQVVYRQAVERHARAGHPVDEAHIASLRRSVIRRLVEEELLFQESLRRGITVLPEDIARAAAALAHRDDDGRFDLEQARRAMTDAQFRRMLHRQLAIERLLDRDVRPRMTVTEAEIRRFYAAHPERFQVPERRRLRHILVRRTAGVDGDGEAEARHKIDMIRARLDKGADFAALARQYSEEAAAAQGGDLGYVQRGQLLPPLAGAAFALEVGETSPVVATEYGFHVIKLVDRRPESATPLEEARPLIHRLLRQEKTERAVSTLVDTLRENADIQAAQ